MSTKYTGGFITKSPVAPTTSAASGIWTLDQQQQAQKAGIWPSPPMFIEDLFSTYLNTPTTSNTAYSINNGIDLSGNGGMVWFKSRTSISNHLLYDTVRGASAGANNPIFPNSTIAQQAANFDYPTFASNGFTVNFATGGGQLTNNGLNYVSWTFREAPKFFDVVTYTGDSVSGRTVSHNLGSVPGFIVIKPVSTGGAWAVAARKDDGNYAYGASSFAFGFNTTEQATSRSVSGLATDTTFTPVSVADVGTCNNSGVTYVAYLFAHNAGGFPVSGGGSTNGISCSSFTTDGSGNATVNLGYEPQWLMIKKISGAGGPWYIEDNMRPFSRTVVNYLNSNSTGIDTEVAAADALFPTATGFGGTSAFLDLSSTYIYIAIRRGPMKTPTVGTSVFYPNAYTGNSTDTAITSTGFPPDLFFSKIRQTDSGYQNMMFDKLRGAGQYLVPTNSDSEGASSNIQLSFNMTGVTLGVGSNVNNSGSTYAQWNFRRAPGFFDEVCYTGTGVAGLAVTHNLGVVPELMIIKTRTPYSSSWIVYTAPTGNAGALYLSSADALETAGGPGYFNNTTPTATQFTVGNYTSTNAGSLVAYLFATLAGVSKVGSYTGTGAAQTINCGFTTGARFVLIKRTDATGGWHVWDSARGIIPSNDPYLLINSIAAEVTGTDYVDTTNVGFDITSTAPAALNANGGTFIFLAIA